MSEESAQKYLIRDAQGNVYGPADAALLREWAGQGRVVAGMFIADRETRQWIEASAHPAVADLLGPGAGTSMQQSGALSPASAPASLPATEAAIDSYQDSTIRRRQNVCGLISFIASLVGAASLVFTCVPMCGCVAWPVMVLLELSAIVLGAIGIFQVRENPTAYSGQSLAVGGLTIGIITLVLCLFILTVGALFFFRTR